MIIPAKASIVVAATAMPNSPQTRYEAMMPTQITTTGSFRGPTPRIGQLATRLAAGWTWPTPSAPPGYSPADTPARSRLALAYLVGAVALVFTAASYAQMVKAFPLSGSVYAYTGRSLGAPIGWTASVDGLKSKSHKPPSTPRT